MRYAALEQLFLHCARAYAIHSPKGPTNNRGIMRLITTPPPSVPSSSQPTAKVLPALTVSLAVSVSKPVTSVVVAPVMAGLTTSEHAASPTYPNLPTSPPNERWVLIPSSLRWSEPVVNLAGRDFEIVASLYGLYPAAVGIEAASAVGQIMDSKLLKCWVTFERVLLSVALVRLAKDLRCPELLDAAKLWGAYVAEKAREDAEAESRALAGGYMACGCSLWGVGSGAQPEDEPKGEVGHVMGCTTASRARVREAWGAMPSEDDMVNFAVWWRESSGQ